jgi:hypothetical protein
LIAAAITGGSITVKNANPQTMRSGANTANFCTHFIKEIAQVRDFWLLCSVVNYARTFG